MRIPTGCDPLDKLLRGGVESGIITEVYGPAGTGKSTVCMQLARGRKAVFIDTEGLSLERMTQVCGNLEKIKIARVRDFDEQHKAILGLAKLKPEIVIIDSMVMLYRLVREEDNAREINQKLAKQQYLLSQLAHELDIPVVITNQVYSPFGTDKVEPAAGDVLKYWPKCIIALEKTGRGLRKAILVKHRSLPELGTCEFKITEKGIE